MVCLTDTFQLGESDNSEKMFSKCSQNSERVLRQKHRFVLIVLRIPLAKNSANDNAQNQSYPILGNRIADTYVRESTGLKKRLYSNST
jgi:predicted helicase